MSDSPQGPGWWQASDGKWYPPEQAPGGSTASGSGGSSGTSFGETFSYAWNKFIQNIGQWILLWLIFVGAFLVLFALSFGFAIATSDNGVFAFSPLAIVFGIVLWPVLGVLLVVIAKAALQAVNGEEVNIGDAFKLTGNNIVAGALFGLIVGVLNAVPFCGGLLSILAYLFLGFVPILSAADDKGAESIGEAWSLSTSRAGEVVPFFAVSWLITACICGIGSPIYLLGGTYLLKRFRGEAVAA